MAEFSSIALLKADINSKVYPNTNFEVTAQRIQDSFTNTIDTLSALLNGASQETYTSLRSKITGGQLVVGKYYYFTYDCKHIIRGTSVLNTSSAQYMANPEVFVAVAIAPTELHQNVMSLNYPMDEIWWDSSSDLCEDGVTQRTGLVTYRKDTQNNLSAYFDFRNVLFRIGKPTAITSWVSGTSYAKGQAVSNAGQGVYVAMLSMNNDTVGLSDESRWTKVTPLSNSENWMPVESMYFFASLTRNTYIDVLAFVSCVNCEIGREYGYTGITMDGCSGVYVGDGSFDSRIVSTNDTEILKISNSYINGSVTFHPKIGRAHV